MTIENKIAWYHKAYKILLPKNQSIGLSRQVFDFYHRNGQIPYGISAEDWKVLQFDHGFFYDIVRIAERTQGKSLPVHYSAFVLEDYNAYAVTAEDGYLVLVDDNFLRLLQVICWLLVSYTQNQIVADEEVTVRNYLQQIIDDFYIKHKIAAYGSNPLVMDIVGREEETAILGTNLARAMQAFILSHEIGHHVLQHTVRQVEKTFSMNGQTITAQVDERSLQDEFEADHFGYQLFHELNSKTTPDLYYSFFEHQLPYAPLLMFELFDILDRKKEQANGKSILYTTHPPPLERRQALIRDFGIAEGHPFFVDLRVALDDLVK